MSRREDLDNCYERQHEEQLVVLPRSLFSTEIRYRRETLGIGIAIGTLATGGLTTGAIALGAVLHPVESVGDTTSTSMRRLSKGASKAVPLNR